MPNHLHQPWTGFILDLETGGTERHYDYNAFSPHAVSQFLETSADPARYTQSAFYRSTFDKKTGKPFQLLEFFGEQYQHQIPFFGDDLEQSWRGFSASGATHLHPLPGFQMSEFSRKAGIEDRARSLGITDRSGAPVTEEAFSAAFYQRLEQQIAENGKVELRAWNGLYDINFLEATTHRYESLQQYRGWFSKQAEAGTFRYRGLEDEMFQALFQYGQETPGFSEQYFQIKPTGKVAGSWEELRQLPGWSVENVTEALGGWKHFVGEAEEAHHAMADVGAERRIGQAFEKANEWMRGGVSAREAIEATALLEKGQTVEGFMSKLLSTPWKSQLGREAATGRRLLAQAEEVAGATRQISMAAPLIGAGIILGAAAAMGLAFGKRTDRQAQITGLRENGLAPEMRHSITRFGSGWQGLDGQEHAHKVVFGAVLAGGAFAGHGWALRHVDGWANRVYRTSSLVEKRFPNQIISTFGASQRASQYLPDSISLRYRDLFHYVGTDSRGRINSAATDMGGQIQRLIGPETSLEQIFHADRDSVLNFIREDKASPYLRMHVNGQSTGHQVSFAKRGSLTASSMRYGNGQGRDYFGDAVEWVRHDDGTGRQIRRGMNEADAAIARAAGEVIPLQPFLAKTENKLLRNVSDRVGRETLGLTERLNRVLNEVHAGIHPGSYASSTELIGKLMTRRVLPAAVGLTALQYGDYLTGHAASNFVWDLFAKGRIAHAEATDNLPGARGITDWYKDHVPGPWYGPLAIPAAGATAGALWHYGKVLSGAFDGTKMAERNLSMWGRPGEFLKDLAKLEFNPGKLGPAGAGLLLGAAAILPLLPGMLGSRKTAQELRSEFSGETPVEIRSGRWWELGSTPLSGNRIMMRRPHAYALHKAHAEDISLYGSEEEKWAHNPLVSPLSWFKDPYYLENKHAADRPYPAASPAFSNVPLIGGLLAATIGKVVKPPKRLQADRWDGSDYTLFTPQLEPKGPQALAPERPKEEFGLGSVIRKGGHAFTEIIGLPGFVARSVWDRLGPKKDGPEVYYQGSRAMTDISRRYYERELGALMAPNLANSGEMFGYSEGIRRFVQHDDTLSANELQNQMPAWLPNGEEYFHDFHRGDPYVGIPMGFARLPGAGYEVLHPELDGVAAEDYPDLEKLRILADVAPWSAKFKQMSAVVGAEAREDPSTLVEYQKIVDGARRVRESTAHFTNRHTGPTDEVEGTVAAATAEGVQLDELPGRTFQFSALSSTAADLSSLAIGEGNQNLADIAPDIERRTTERDAYLSDRLKPGTKVRLVTPRGGLDVSQSRAVVFAGDTNINTELIHRGFAKTDMEAAGAEVQAMDGPVGRMMRQFAEGVAFSGGEAWYNPLRYVPRPFHSKLWQEREPIEQYLQQEVYGTRSRRWERPIHDMAMPWMHGAAYRMTNRVIIPEETQEKRDLDTMADQLAYLRELSGMTRDPAHRGMHAMKAARTAIGSDLFGPSELLLQTLPGRDRKYFNQFLHESDPERRSKILASVSKEMADALLAQWVQDSARIARAEGESVAEYNQSGRLVTGEDADRMADMHKGGAESPDVTVGDSFRAREIAEFFARRGLKLPDPDDAALADEIDYQDVKLKIIQWEGLDSHDFGLYDDRVAMLSRKPYLDGAVRELTSGDDRSVEEMTAQVERAIAMSKAKDPNAVAKMTRHAARKARQNVRITIETKPDDELQKEIRRNPEDYR